MTLAREVLYVVTNLGLRRALLTVIMISIPGLTRIVRRFVFQYSTNVETATNRFLRSELDFDVLTLMRVYLYRRALNYATNDAASITN